MELKQVRRELADLTASQWGMVTTSQAATRGITRLQMSRLAQDGDLERIGHGIYRDSGSPPQLFDSIKAAWLSVNPRHTAEERLAIRLPDAVVSGAAASHLLGLGDLVPEPYEFTVSGRRQTQRAELSFRVRRLPAKSVTRREGLPVTTPEQTIADLVEARMDLSLVADVLADTESLDSNRLVELLSPLASRNGFGRGDGQALFAELERLAHRDVDSLAKAVAAAAPLAQKVLEAYLKTLDPEALAVAARSIMRSLTPALEAHSKSPNLSRMASAMTEGMTEALRQSSSQTAQLAATALAQSVREAATLLPTPQIPLDARVSRQLVQVADQMRRHQTSTHGSQRKETPHG